MIRALTSFLSVCLFFCCSKKTAVVPAYTPPRDTVSFSSTDTAKSFLALGDSYTIGQSVAATERFPAQIVALLKSLRIKVSDPVYIAQTGWTTSNLQAAITLQNPLPTYDVVTLLIGVNDQYQHLDTGGYAQRFTQLLARAIELAQGRKERVFVLSIPDYSVTPFVSATDKPRVRMEIEQFNAINKRITIAYGVSYTDITPSTRQAGTNAALLANDNLHPSGLEYKKWAEMLLPKIKAVLQ